jgi:hypothetical protein
MASRSRYLIGIDLGTTNTVVSYVDTHETAEKGDPVMRLLPIPQLVAEREVRDFPSLPSFLFFTDAHEAADVRLPWDERPDAIAGVFARDRGALEPSRLVASAKSWLCHGEVDRRARVLPWGNDNPSLGCSPVEASARYLAHIRDAWNHSASVAGPTDADAFERQDVVITIPASFDEDARALTLEAARIAGLRHVVLLEEPLAAFYCWIVAYRDSLAERLSDNDLALVCDVGGGTTDFSLVRARVRQNDVEFERTAVGDHLLLGGDNVDFAIAAHVEAKLGRPRITTRQRNALRQQCRAAKEILLSDPDVDRVPITVLGGGSALVGGALKTDLSVDEIEEILVSGFLPPSAANDLPVRERARGLRELGLPYASDAAITKHLAEFLTRAARAEGREGMLRPDAILFNGGFFIPEGARQIVVDTIATWFDGGSGWRPRELVDDVAESAVAVGAAYYAHVRRTGGSRVGGGAPRTFYLALQARPDSDAVPAVCLLPHGTLEGTLLRLDDREFVAVANRPATFTLFSSTVRHARHGEVVSLRDDEATRLAPLVAVLKLGKRNYHADVPVRVTAEYTEAGALELWCEARNTPHRWRLQFQLGGDEYGTVEEAHTVVSDDALDAAEAIVRSAFAAQAPRAPRVAPMKLTALVEKALRFGKTAWPIMATRRLADCLLEVAEGRAASPAHEARWLNLTGFCLRPGFGADGDERRAEAAWRVVRRGLLHTNDVQCRVEWAVFLHRASGGFDADRQAELYRLVREAPSAIPSPQVERESIRLLASLERLPARIRSEIGREIVTRLASDPGNRNYLWAIGRVGARFPVYGPAGSVVPPMTVTDWIEEILALPIPIEEVGPALVRMAAMTGDSHRDVDRSTREAVAARLRASGRSAAQPAGLFEVIPPDRAQLAASIGEALPEGLRLLR